VEDACVCVLALILGDRAFMSRRLADSERTSSDAVMLKSHQYQYQYRHHSSIKAAGISPPHTGREACRLESMTVISITITLTITITINININITATRTVSCCSSPALS
jgi:siderophore synthetase component